MSANKDKYFEVVTVRLVKAPNKTAAMKVVSKPSLVLGEDQYVSQITATQAHNEWNLETITK